MMRLKLYNPNFYFKYFSIFFALILDFKTTYHILGYITPRSLLISQNLEQ